MQRADEGLHVRTTHRVVAFPGLGLDVDQLESEFVLADDTVDPAVAAVPADPFDRALEASVAHLLQHVEDESLEPLPGPFLDGVE